MSRLVPLRTLLLYWAPLRIVAPLPNLHIVDPSSKVCTAPTQSFTNPVHVIRSSTDPVFLLHRSSAVYCFCPSCLFVVFELFNNPHRAMNRRFSLSYR